MDISIHPLKFAPRLLYFLRTQAAGELNFYSGLALRYDGELVDIVVNLVGWRWWDGW